MNPAFVFGVAVLAAVVVISIWTGGWRTNYMANWRAHFKKFARDFVITGIIIWVPWLAWRFGWVSS